MSEEQSTNKMFMEDIRAKSREEHKGARSLRRATVFGCKRLHLDQLEEEYQDISRDQVKELAERVKKSAKEQSVLRKLKHAFAQGDTEKQVFLKVSGALHSLIGLLTCHDAGLQLEALSCLINLLTAEHRVIKAVVREASPYLVLYLSSSSSQVQELAVWALGNIAADCADCCEILRVQQFLPALLHLLQTNTPDLVHPALFALRCYMMHRPEDWGEILLSGLGQGLPLFLKSSVCKPVLLEAANIFFYLSTSADFVHYLLSSGCLEAAFSHLRGLVTAATKGDEVLLNHRDSQIVTYLVRGLAGAFTEEEAAVQWVKASQSSTQSPHVLQMLLLSNYLHLHKEVLWLLGNLAGHGAEDIVKFFVDDQELLKAIVAKLFGPLDVVEQGLICACNLLLQKYENLCDVISASVTDDALVRLLCSSSSAIVSLTFTFVSLSRTRFEKLYEVIRGLSHHPNESIRQMAVTFLQTC